MSAIRFKLSDFTSVYRQLKEQKRSFEVFETSYTRRIKIDKKTLLFSDKAMTPVELKMIQQIRKSADTFEAPTLEEKAPQIAFYKYFDTKPETTFKGIKIDLNQAYWQSAINMGLITPKIQYYFEDNKESLGGEKNVKMARLRSLGALATKKTVKQVCKGELIDEELVYNKAHRELYLYICEQVANVMHELAFHFMEHVIYYYWDCIFLSDKVNIEQVNKKIIELGFDSKLEGQGEYQIFKGQHVSYLLDVDKNVKYPILESDLIK